MGFGGISIWQLLIVLAIVILLFGTKRLRSFGGDLGSAVKGFRKAMDTADKDGEDKNQIKEEENDVIEGQAEKVSEKEDSQKQP